MAFDTALDANLYQKGEGVYNAGHSDFGSDSDSDATRIQAAIDAAKADSVPIVVVPDSMLPYSGVTFDSSVRMVREGQQADVYDVKAYGAAGDGTTDDHAAFDAAVENSSREGPIYIPNGTYIMGSLLRTYGARVFGETRDGAVIKMQDGADLFAVLRGNRDDAHVSDLTLDGNKANNTSGKGFEANNRSRVTVENVRIINTVEQGLEFANTCSDCEARRIWVDGADQASIRVVGEDCEVGPAWVVNSNGALMTGSQDSMFRGIHVQGATSSESVVISGSSVNCELVGCTSRDGAQNGAVISAGCQGCAVRGGAYINNTNNGVSVDTNTNDATPEPGEHRIVGVVARSNGDHGINVQNTPDTVVSGCTSEGNSKDGLRLTGTESTGCAVTGCRSRNNGADGLTVGADNCAVAGNVLTGNTGSSLVDNGTGTQKAANVT